jgi:S-adenosyl-L-methionine hydrolase (adenosine-forming)
MIIILSDFKESIYAGIMKGIIKSINQKIEIIEININHFSIIEGSFILKNSYSFFPKGTIFICSIQPEKEQPIIIKTKDYFFIGCDNGLMYETIKNDQELIVKLENEKNHEQLYAKSAALLSNEFDLLKLGKIYKIKNKLLLKEQIVSIDNFGNIITNLKNKEYENNKTYNLKHKNKIYKLKYYNNFNNIKKNEIFITSGTFNTIEICMKENNANEKLKFKIGDKIELK